MFDRGPIEATKSVLAGDRLSNLCRGDRRHPLVGGDAVSEPEVAGMFVPVDFERQNSVGRRCFGSIAQDQIAGPKLGYPDGASIDP